MSAMFNSPFWNSALYDEKHGFVARMAEDLVSLLAPQAGERILDLGCGTGHLTQSIASHGASVIGIDSAASMIDQARRNYPGLEFQLASGEDFRFAEPFDAVFSNAALHWMKQAEAVAACVWQALRPGGRFVAEMGGKGNIDQLYGGLLEAIRAQGLAAPAENPWYFPSLGDYTTLLERQGFRVVYATYFNRSTPLEGDDGLRNWLRMFAGNVLHAYSEDQRTRIIEEAERRLRPILYRSGGWAADYVRLRVIAVRPQ